MNMSIKYGYSRGSTIVVMAVGVVAVGLIVMLSGVFKEKEYPKIYSEIVGRKMSCEMTRFVKDSPVTGRFDDLGEFDIVFNSGKLTISKVGVSDGVTIKYSIIKDTGKVLVVEVDNPEASGGMGKFSIERTESGVSGKYKTWYDRDTSIICKYK